MYKPATNFLKANTKATPRDIPELRRYKIELPNRVIYTNMFSAVRRHTNNFTIGIYTDRLESTPTE